uniref:Uncharacterized protein n=2 Tax=Octactis speculum TaxID=3111310 RepID=A0A7S2B3W6_9STRA|mmetsp:Transcript_18659/g.25311  ORF Transcript_18659/g.25311 Transcript_18659/m.25311 type:complete len:313 (+) Transcript_18659:128-1066(+)
MLSAHQSHYPKGQRGQRLDLTAHTGFTVSGARHGQSTDRNSNHEPTRAAEETTNHAERAHDKWQATPADAFFFEPAEDLTTLANFPTLGQASEQLSEEAKGFGAWSSRLSAQQQNNSDFPALMDDRAVQPSVSHWGSQSSTPLNDQTHHGSTERLNQSERTTSSANHVIVPPPVPTSDDFPGLSASAPSNNAAPGSWGGRRGGRAGNRGQRGGSRQQGQRQRTRQPINNPENISLALGLHLGIEAQQSSSVTPTETSAKGASSSSVATKKKVKARTPKKVTGVNSYLSKLGGNTKKTGGARTGISVVRNKKK